MRNSESFIGEQIDCADLGVGTIIEVRDNIAIVAVSEGITEIELDDLELNEEVEDLEELSKATVKSYMNKAFDSGVKAMTKKNNLPNTSTSDDIKPYNAIIRKRSSGLSMAKTRLAKEDLDEGTSKPYVKPHNDAKGKQYGWKASNKHGKVKYFGLDFKAAAHKHAGLNEENLEELSKKTLASYVKSATKSLGNAEFYTGAESIRNTSGPAKKALMKTANKREKGIFKAIDKLTKEEVELEEGRGRKPKEPKEGEKPTAAWLRHLERSKQSDKPEEVEALSAQLRKAVSINKPVTFANGEKKEVHPSHVDRFNDHMDARKPAEKQKFQKDAHASHDAFLKLVKSPIPGK